MAQNILRPDAGALRQQLLEAALGRDAAQQRQRVHIGQIFFAVVCRPVHMDGHIGDHQQIPVDIHQPDRQLLPLPDQHPARCGEGAVQPGAHEHPAVFFRAQLDIVPRRQLFRLLLELEGGGIGMGRRQHIAAGQLLRRAEGQNGRAVADDIILSARPDGPGLLLPQGLIARLLQQLLQICDHMITAGAFADEPQQLPCQRLLHKKTPPFSCCSAFRISCSARLGKRHFFLRRRRFSAILKADHLREVFFS